MKQERPPPIGAGSPTPQADSPLSAKESAAVRTQLERILASSPFRNSKRYPALLRYVVERALEGQASELKERNIAVDVFGRSLSYEPSADPIVRITAAEVRKRLAQYYQVNSRSNELIIDLPLGSYVPEFRSPAETTASSAASSTALQKRREVPRLAILIGFSVLLIGIGLLFWFRGRNQRLALDQFWAPVIASPGSVMLCVGPSPQSDSHASQLPSAVGWADVMTLARLTGPVAAHQKSFRFCRADRVTFSEFERTAAVLVGAFNDDWTIRLMQGSRFTFRHEGSLEWIEDRQNPASKKWSLNTGDISGNKPPNLKQDYAIVSRIFNTRTGGITITVAGLFGFGTDAAGKFLTDSTYMQSLIRSAPPDWQRKNLQLVIGTEIVAGSAGPPHVLATTFW